MRDIFGEFSVFGSFFGLGSHPEPPDIVPLRILGLNAMPATQDAARAAFKARLKQVHPDVDAYTAVPELQEAADAAAAGRPEVAEVVWARDVLLRKIPASVTGNDVARGDSDNRHAYTPRRCKACDEPWIDHRGRLIEYGRWKGLCWRCAIDAENGHQRDLRRQRRANRICECGETFTPARSDGRYCSPACRQRAYRQRRTAS